MTTATDSRKPVAIMIRLSESDAARLRLIARSDDRAPAVLARRLILNGITQLEQDQPAVPA